MESIQGCGLKTPDPQGDLIIEGCVWPLGERTQDPQAPFVSPLPGNEYVVYKARRAIPNYLVKVELPTSLWWL